jgi:hypothetical protein
MTLEDQFYKIITPEGKQNYVIDGQAKIILLLCQEIDRLNAIKEPLCPICNEPLSQHEKSL